MTGIHVRTTYHTDPKDPKGPCLLRAEVWPLPQEAVPGLAALMDAVAKQYLRDFGLAGPGETDLSAKGPAQ